MELYTPSPKKQILPLAPRLRTIQLATFYGEQCTLVVTEENREAWRCYLKKVIKKHLFH